MVQVSGGGEANTGNDSANDPTTIHSAQNCGIFAPTVSYGAGTNPNSVAIGDFNGDGKADVAVADYGGNVSILLGDGDGTFAAAGSDGDGGQSNEVAVGDFSGR